MIEVVITTPKGKLLEQSANFVLVRGSDGERGYLINHTPVMMNIDDGHMRIDSSDKSIFVSLKSGIMDLNKNKMTVVCEMGETGSTLEEAKANLEKLVLTIKEENKRKMVDFVSAEKELVKSIKKMRAGDL